MTETWAIDPDYDERQALRDAAAHLLDLDAAGCALVLRIAETLEDYLGWDPSDSDQITTFQALVTILLGDPSTLEQMLPLIRARAEDRRECEAAERRAKRYRRRLTRPTAPVIHLVPPRRPEPD